jgi:PmbA protein
MNTTEKYALAEMIIGHALKGGAAEASVTISESRSTSIEIRDQKIDSLKESNRSNLSISLFVDKKFSSHSTNRLKEEDLKKFVDEAIIATRYLAEDEYRALPEPEMYYKGGAEALNTFDPQMDAIDTKTKISLATDALNEAYGKDERIISVSSSYGDNISNMVMVKSNGFKAESSSTGVSVYVSVSVKSDSGRPSDYWYENSMFFKGLKSSDIGSKALERTIRKIGPRKIASGKYQVVVENRVAGNLGNPIFSALSGSSIYNRQSFLIDKIGKQIASPALTVIDDPLEPGGQGSRLFDEEGLAALKRPIIENGILRNYYIDTYYGRKLGMKPTSGSSSNVNVGTGTRGMDEFVKSMKKGVLITGFIGGNFNGSTGDFSYGIEGYLVEDGNIVHPVNEMNITGNMTTFWFNLVETGNDVLPNQSLRMPSLMFRDVELSGL